MKEKIDFVITWVDGNDEVWRNEKEKYNPNKGTDNSVNRFRDWENLKYWFRGVEKYANWVNKIYFITYGHLPKWLNTENEKLVIINHKDYIPEKYLPTFNSNCIELNINRIKGLSSKFVLFNDDMFLINNVLPKDFFNDDLPCDQAIMNCYIPECTVMDYINLNNIEVINKYYNSKVVLKNNFSKWYNLKYGKYVLKNVIFSKFENFSSIRFHHLPTSFLKESFDYLWKIEPEVFDICCMNKFRSKDDINQWLIQDYQLVEGKFYPRKMNFGRYVRYNSDNSEIYNIIENQKYKVVCLNDVAGNYNFENEKKKTINAFEKILPEKSSFEK